MSNTDNSSAGAKPTIIDLDAEHVIEETAETETHDGGEPPAPPAAQHKRSSWRPLGWLALALAVMTAGGWFYKELLSTYFPSDALQAATQRIDVLEAQTKTLNDQLTALANQSETMRGAQANTNTQADEATAAVRTLTAKTSDNGSRLAGVENSVAELKSALDALKTQPAPAVSTNNWQGPALAALAARVEALQKELAGMKSVQPSNSVAERNATLSQALSDMKAKIAAGTSYKAEYDRIATLVPAAAGLDALAARAAEGLPNAKGLAQELRVAIPSLPKPETEQPAGDGYFAALWDSLGSIVTIRNIGEANWPALAESSAQLADAGDLAGAIKLIDAAEGDKPVAITQWRDRAAARLALQATLAETEAAVLRQLAGATP